MVKSTPHTYRIALVIIAGAILLGVLPLAFYFTQNKTSATLPSLTSLWPVLYFTVKQAFLSTLISIALGLPLALALNRREFFGKRLLLNICAIPQSLPAIVAVLGLVSIYGQSGVIGGLFNVYGLIGILMVHVFFNMPLAARFFINDLQAIPSEHYRLAAQLSFTDRTVFRLIEWPAISGTLPRVAALIFLLCAASFVVVLTLGGPTSTTLEVAIYQSLRFDFDLNRAIALSALQILLSIIFASLAGKMALQTLHSPPVSKTKRPFLVRGKLSLATDSTAVALALIILLPPICALVAYGITNLTMSSNLVLGTATSFFIGSFSSLLTTAIAWPLARANSQTSRLVSLAGIIIPPAVLATGWFIALKNLPASMPLTLTTIIALNSLMALPFAVTILSDAFLKLGQTHEKLCAQLEINHWNKFWLIDLPLLRKATTQSFLMCFTLSLGDLTAVTLLGNQGLITLPSLLHQQMGNYRSAEANGTALILAILCFCVAVFAQRQGERS
jgi:thiamine transport system permease protein